MSGPRTRFALMRLRWALQRRDIPCARRRQIIAEVRANLHEASADFGEREALRRLGNLEELGAEYGAGQGRTALRVHAGIRAALITVAVLAALTVIRVPTFNTMDTFDRHTGATTWEWEVWRLWRFGGDIATDTLFEGTVYSYAFILLPAVAFGLWSRPWRLARVGRTRPGRRRPPASA